MQRKNLIPRLLDISLDVSKIAVCIYSIEADNDYHEDLKEDIRQALESQIEAPKDFVEKQGRPGPGRGLELKRKWSQVEYLIKCIYNGRTIPCADGFELYKVEKKRKLKLFKMDAFLPTAALEDAIIDKSYDDIFEAAMIDYEISFHLLEDILQEKEPQ